MDPLKAPLWVVAVGLGLAILSIALGMAIYALMSRDASIAGLSTFMSELSVGSDATVVVGCVMLARLKRPGSSLALVAGVFHGINILFVGLWFVVTTATSIVSVMSVANALVDVAGVGVLALSLRELAKSRGRSYDGWLFAAAIAMGLTALVAFVNIVTSFPVGLYYATSAVGVFARVVMVLVALALVLAKGAAFNLV